MSGHLGLDLGHAHLGHAKATGGRARRLHDVDGELDFVRGATDNNNADIGQYDKFSREYWILPIS